MRLLIAEDDVMLASGLRRALQHAGYTVDVAASAEEATSAVRAQDYALMLLDLEMPGGSGLETLRDLRARRDATPVIIVTARDRAEEKVEGLDAGADDYVVKPFDLDELLARIRAQTRRREQRTSDILSAHGVTLDLAARTVASPAGPVPMTAKEFKVLAGLMRRLGQFVSKEELEGLLYDNTAEVESNTIEVTVYALRRKLGSEFIVTARGLGYTIPKRR
jgi:DNA-binding response OmpR family regulator